MTTPAKLAREAERRAVPPRKIATYGVYSRDWHKWRGAVLEVALAGEKPFCARLDSADPARGDAEVSLLKSDNFGKIVGVRTIPWPPPAPGRVRVIRGA
jgi:hypothetical protein